VLTFAVRRVKNYYAMSHLASSFIRRQPQHASIRSTSTVSSSEGGKQVENYEKNRQTQLYQSSSSPSDVASSSKHFYHMNVSNSKGIKVGEHITHIYHNCFSQVK
jgi:hypothetical protein